jgi:hypothetical protein
VVAAGLESGGVAALVPRDREEAKVGSGSKAWPRAHPPVR